MSFREVLRAKNKTILEESLHTVDFASPSLSAFNNLKECYQEYLFTGGMPQAVQASIDENSILASREIHRSTISTYKDGFGKYGKRIPQESIDKVFDYIHLHLSYRFNGLEAPELFYWLREGKSNNAEVDFVISNIGKLAIIEIKSGKSGSLRSVHQQIAKTGLNRAYRFYINPPSIQDVHTSVRSKDGQQEIAFE